MKSAHEKKELTQKKEFRKKKQRKSKGTWYFRFLSPLMKEEKRKRTSTFLSSSSCATAGVQTFSITQVLIGTGLLPHLKGGQV
jgi:hypothetical protein